MMTLREQLEKGGWYNDIEIRKDNAVLASGECGYSHIPSWHLGGEEISIKILSEYVEYDVWSWSEAAGFWAQFSYMDGWVFGETEEDALKNLIERVSPYLIEDGHIVIQ